VDTIFTEELVVLSNILEQSSATEDANGAAIPMATPSVTENIPVNEPANVFLILFSKLLLSRQFWSVERLTVEVMFFELEGHLPPPGGILDVDMVTTYKSPDSTYDDRTISPSKSLDSIKVSVGVSFA